jgi:DNA-binding NarL/FixJ family response regulator
MSEKRKVFLVDDHPLVCDGLTTLIDRQADLQVCGTATSAPQALQAIEQLQPDAAIIDITLESGSGLELIKDLQACCPEVALLALSMHDESVYAQRAIQAGARGYVMKREATKKVVAALREVLAGNLFVSDAFAKKMAEKLLDKRGDRSSPGDALSDRELEVFEMLGRGWETRRIADSLKISMKTVQTYCARIKEKMALRTANELLLTAVRWVEEKQRQ